MEGKGRFHIIRDFTLCIESLGSKAVYVHHGLFVGRLGNWGVEFLIESGIKWTAIIALFRNEHGPYSPP